MLITRLRRSGMRKIVRFGLGLGALAIRRPSEAADHVLTQVALTRSSVASRTPVAATPDWRRVLHQRIGTAWPCDASVEFRKLWNALADGGAPVPPAAVDHDADPTLAEMVWCLVRHMQPRVVVETGVSRGITSRVILEALAQNGGGHLWSVDLPPLEEPWRRLVGTAVPATMRERWTYVRGASRRRLPDVCRHVEPIDLFVHDSLHTPDNLGFELATVWPHLRPGAGVVIDDAEECGAAEVVQRFTRAPLLGANEKRKGTSVVFTSRPSESIRTSVAAGP